jgi:hypothetical protein
MHSAIRFTWAWHQLGEEQILPGSLRLIAITLSQLVRTCVVTLVTGMAPHIKIEEKLNELAGATQQTFSVSAVPDEKKASALLCCIL